MLRICRIDYHHGMTAHAPERSFTWSDLARRPGEVGEAIDEYGEVTVLRGRATLRLAVEPASTLVDFSVQLCRVLNRLVALEDDDVVTEVLTSAWPWTRALPADDQLMLAGDVANVAEMCVSLHTFRPLERLLEDWQRTARAWADGMRPLGRIDEPLGTPVPRPDA